MTFDVNKFEKSVDKYAKEITYIHTPRVISFFFANFYINGRFIKPKTCIFVYEMTKFWANIKF